MQRRPPSILACLAVFFPLLLPAGAAVLRVRSGAVGLADGGSWATAFGSIPAAITASAPGDEIWVAEGVYLGSITAKSEVALYGGFAGIETAREERIPRLYETVLDGDMRGSVVIIPEGAASGTVVDGFTIRNGSGTFVPREPQGTLGAHWGGGVYSRRADPTIANNRIVANGISLTEIGYRIVEGGGIYCEGGAPVVRDNLISGNRAWTGAAIRCENANLTLVGNTISENLGEPRLFDTVAFIDARLYGGAVYCRKVTGVMVANTVANNAMTWKQGSGWISGFGGGILCMDSTMAVERNRITGNRLTVSVEDNARAAGAGLYSLRSELIVAGNLIAGNKAQAQAFYPTAHGAGLTVQGGVVHLVNNTVVDNTVSFGGIYPGPLHGGGIYLEGAASASCIANNIVAGNTSGLWTDATLPVRNNNIYGNADYDVQGIEYPVGVNGNISADPLFADPGRGDYRPRADSPAINAGDDGAIQGQHDLDGLPRFVPPHVDMGAYEHQAPPFTVADAAVALKIAGGLTCADTAMLRYNVVRDGDSTDRIDRRDAVALARKAAGLERNP